MLKVIVADDEEKICQLIVKLIDWQALDMEVVFIASNGIETMDAIEKYKPDIVITDIRMPGMDGLQLIKKTKEAGYRTEFVIISGYRHFEYAQKAIRYGVGDYLLKPIKKDELYQTLNRLKERYREINEQLTYEERVRLVIKNDAGRLRTTYFSSILYGSSHEIRELSLEEINRNYYYQMRAGLYQILCVKFDRIEADTENLKFIADKTAALVEQLFSGDCYDYEIYVEGSFLYLLLNYGEENQKSVRRQIKSMLDEFMVLESIFEGMRVTIGAGQFVSGPDQIAESLKDARLQAEQRLVTGCCRVISDEAKTDSGLADSELFYQFNRDMNRALESLDTQQVRTVLCELRDSLKTREGITGHEILQMTKEACNVFLFSMKNQKIIIDNAARFLEEYNRNASDCADVDELFELLTRELFGCYEKAVQSKRSEDDRPIRIAKNYMAEHYMDQVTLEDVSAIAGFSSTYFSSLFKKETGTAFLEYLSGLRMEEAKRLLRETNHNISCICQAVGYSDVKYFTKSFIKYTGLKPTEYRKIYS